LRLLFARYHVYSGNHIKATGKNINLFHISFFEYINKTKHRGKAREFLLVRPISPILFIILFISREQFGSSRADQKNISKDNDAFALAIFTVWGCKSHLALPLSTHFLSFLFLQR
jgi:hypothetical protein